MDKSSVEVIMNLGKVSLYFFGIKKILDCIKLEKSMNHNYFNNLSGEDFHLLYLGNWSDKILSDADEHLKVDVIEECEVESKIKSKDDNSILCVKSDFEGSIYRDSDITHELYLLAKYSGKRVVILGYRGLGVVKEL